MLPLSFYLIGLASFFLSVDAKASPGPIPGLPANALTSAPRQIKAGRCTELQPSIIEKFERQFTLDKAGLTSGLSSVLGHHNRSKGHGGSKPLTSGILNRRQSPLNPVKVYFHIISADSTPGKGNVPLSQVEDQVEEMNRGFSTPGGKSFLIFELAGVDRTVNADWFSNGGPDTPQQTAMKTALRKGGRADLNVYTVDFTGAWSPLLGYSTFPQSYNEYPMDDGVVVRYSTLPGGTTKNYNGGKTTVHEVGHWVGLYHTFQGSCFGPGDYVEDTMPEGAPSQGCMEGRATCPVANVAQGETDPIHNYMDYSTDPCMTEFTPGQMDRARQQLTYYRGIEFH